MSKLKGSKISEIITLIKKNRTIVLVAVIVGLLVLPYSVFAIGIYKYGWDNGVARKVASVFPFPVEKVGGKFVSYNEYIAKLDPQVNYQKSFNNVNFASDEGKAKLKNIKDSVMNQLAEEVILRAESKKRNIAISESEFNGSFDDLIKSNGGEEKVQENLKKYYNGMTLSQFKEQYREKMLRQKISDALSKDESLNESAKKQAESVLAELKSGKDFAELAKKYGQDNTAPKGGDLGSFSKGKMVPEFEKAAFALDKNATSGLVKTVYGYHIIKVTEKNGDQIRASHILIKTKDFNEWLKDKVTEAKVKRYLNK